MVQDRGSIKWTSLMLPEHVELLKSIWTEDTKVKKPLLDEQELELINSRLMEAYQHKQPIQITYYKHAQLVEAKGIIKKLEQHNSKVFIKKPGGDLIAINFYDICSVN
ncbi:YolD-like family protein [Ornithinibacillus halotolerans]|uniref:YolD-like family protein n=1 Tax=Ornithinibacillus halotolerans TaxID=1274357 RepID=A0A916W2Y9_9BACI|nr:YolD-like family protein [Ornithinibacillus halotolerans]GGA61758.1 hypothetical protein GCM10008025_02140 [Ornithinibacillus halotolerans]